MKRLRQWTVVGAVGCLTLTAAACGSTSNSSGPSSGASGGATAAASAAIPPYTGTDTQLADNYPVPKSCGKVALQEPTTDQAGPLIEKEAFDRQVAKLGGQSVVIDDKIDPTQQVANFRNEISEGYKAISVYPLDPSTMNAAFAEAKSKGVGVIVIDYTQGAVPANADYSSDVSSVRDNLAYQQMKVIAERDPGAQIGLITLSVQVPGIQYQIQRLQYWAQKMGLKVDGVQQQGTDDPAGGQQAGTALLARFPDIKAIATYNDQVSLGVANAAKLMHKKVLSIGANGNPNAIAAAAKGTIVDFETNDPLEGVALANGLCALSIGEKIPTEIRASIIGPIDQSNASTVPSQQQLMTKVFSGGSN